MKFRLVDKSDSMNKSALRKSRPPAPTRIEAAPPHGNTTEADPGDAVASQAQSPEPPDASQEDDKQPGLLSKLWPRRSKDDLPVTETSGPAIATPPGRVQSEAQTSKPPVNDKITRFADTATVLRPDDQVGEAVEAEVPTRSGDSTEPEALTWDQPTGTRHKLKKGRPEVTEGDIGTPAGGAAIQESRGHAKRPPGKKHDVPSGAIAASTAPSGVATPLDEVALPDGSTAYVRPETSQPTEMKGPKEGKGAASDGGTALQGVMEMPQAAEASEGDSTQTEAREESAKPLPPRALSKFTRKKPPPPQGVSLPTAAGEEDIAEEDPSREAVKGGETGRTKKTGGTTANLTPEEQKLDGVRALARQSFRPSIGRT